MAAYPEKIAPVYTAADIRRNAAAGKISGMLTIEEGACCKGSVFILTVDWLGWLCYFLDEKQFIRTYFHHCHSKPHEWNTLFLGF